MGAGQRIDCRGRRRRVLERTWIGLSLDFCHSPIVILQTASCQSSRQASGLKTRNPSEPASRWKRQGKIFGVPVDRADLYPAFQFLEGRPQPEVRRVLAALPVSMSPRQIALWFASGNGWVEDDAAPQDALHDMDGVLAAAADFG